MAEPVDSRAMLFRILLVWGALLLLGAANLAYALVPGLPFKPAFALVIVAMQAALVFGAFMNLGKASALVRVTALTGAVWLSFLFLMSFADLWTR